MTFTLVNWVFLGFMDGFLAISDSSTLPHPQPHSHYACTHTHPCTRLPYFNSSGMHKVATAAGHLKHGRPCEWVTKERAVNGILFLKVRIFRLVSVEFKTKVWKPLDGATYIQLWDLKAMVLLTIRSRVPNHKRECLE